tara:strand:+ start:115 stop:921 length:807 start_codon:yes stop_codon:yes gene_type:complete
MIFDVPSEFQKLFADAALFEDFKNEFSPGWHGYQYFSLDTPETIKKVRSIGEKRMKLIGEAGEWEMMKAQPHLYRSRGYGVFSTEDQTTLMVCLGTNIFRRAVASENSESAIRWAIREKVYYRPRLLPVQKTNKTDIVSAADVEIWINEKISFSCGNTDNNHRFLIISGLHLYSDIKSIRESLKALPADVLQRMHEARLSSSPYIFSGEFGYGVAGMFRPRFVVKHKQHVWLFKIPTRLRDATVQWAKTKNIYDEARAVEQMLMQNSA